jgi:hypothetical protein
MGKEKKPLKKTEPETLGTDEKKDGNPMPKPPPIK